MSQPSFERIGVLPLVVLTACAVGLPAPASGKDAKLPGGALDIIDAEGKSVGSCPLKHTDVTADIAGFVGRVTVKQVFHNPLDRKIEAVYVFPLPQDAAVDDMVMTVGDRRVIGQVKPRDEAREVYEAAKAAGHVASLLDQERPNIFTQSVANIEPGVEVVIEISYVETLKYEDGVFEWVFPMVVGPRYIPGGGTAQTPMTKGQDTPQVPDGSKITPPVTPEGTRAGHDISITVNLDAGMELHDLESTLHEVDVEVIDPSQAVVSLKNQAEIPNKDFILRYRLATDEIGDAFLVHEDERGRFFTLVLQPPKRVVPAQLVPREIVFVLDTSGSMSGYPIETAKKVMARTIDTMHAGDTFNLITFAGDTHILWDVPRPATPENIAEAQAFLASRQGGGGTEMMKAIDAALRPTSTMDRAEEGAESPMWPEELIHQVPRDQRVSVVFNVTELQAWPPPNVRSDWSGVVLRTPAGVFEVAHAPAGAHSMGRMWVRASGVWKWARRDVRKKLDIKALDWLDVAPGELMVPQELAEVLPDGRRVALVVPYGDYEVLGSETRRHLVRTPDGPSIRVSEFQPEGLGCKVGERLRLTGVWETIDGEARLTVERCERQGRMFTPTRPRVLTAAELLAQRGELGDPEGPQLVLSIAPRDMRNVMWDGAAPGVFDLSDGSDEMILVQIRKWTLDGQPFDDASDEPVLMRGQWRDRKGRRVFDVAHAISPGDDLRKLFEGDIPATPAPIRVVCFMTDGYVGNDMEIIGAVRKYAGTTRVFSLGIGNGVNRFLLDGMAAAGRGEVEYVTLMDPSETGPADAAAERFHERILAPVLTDIAIDWGDLPVADVLPGHIPDLFSAKPIMIHGRLTGAPQGTITLRGNTGGGAYETQIECDGPTNVADGISTSNPALPSLWARARVGELMMRDMAGLQHGNFPDDLKAEITNLGIEFRLMTQFTSFVAVEEMTVTMDGEPVRVDVPVEMPEGVSYEGVFGQAGGRFAGAAKASRRGRGLGRTPTSPAPMPPPRTQAELGQAAPAEEADAIEAGAFDGQRIKPEDAWKLKLRGPLAGLAERVEKDGQDGDLTVDNVRVTKYRVRVMVYLRDATDETLAALAKLGFEKAGESKAVSMLIGTIDVRRLEELAKLDAVLRVTPLKT